MLLKADLSVAATMECEHELLPYLPELLQDFDSLGSNPDVVIALLEVEAARDIHTALDLCCGKGATAIALAKHFSIEVEGVDAIEAFIEAAKSAAITAGVSEQCRFITGDICDTVVKPANYDLVIFSAIGPILGGITKTITHLLTPLRKGGWLLIDDCVLLPNAPIRKGFEAHAGFDETRAQIEQAGAEIVTVRRRPRDDVLSSHEVGNEFTQQRAVTLINRKPELAELVNQYVERQHEECAFLEQWTEDVTWLLKKP
ncbi:MAG: class I SAM-dependent methyltransferase [Gammaproteobacteria bacterium]